MTTRAVLTNNTAGSVVIDPNQFTGTPNLGAASLWVIAKSGGTLNVDQKVYQTWAAGGDGIIGRGVTVSFI
jgi:hypothetical protein